MNHDRQPITKIKPSEWDRYRDGLPLALGERERINRQALIKSAPERQFPGELNPFSGRFVPNSERIGFQLDIPVDENIAMSIYRATDRITAYPEKSPEIIITASIPKHFITEYFAPPRTSDEQIMDIEITRPGAEGLRDFLAALQEGSRRTANQQRQTENIAVRIELNGGVDLIAGEQKDSPRFHISRHWKSEKHNLVDFVNGQLCIQGIYRTRNPRTGENESEEVTIPIDNAHFYAAYRANKLPTLPKEDISDFLDIQPLKSKA
jgi:hypothetical protein